jgi:hypothetical protein
MEDRRNSVDSQNHQRPTAYCMMLKDEMFCTDLKVYDGYPEEMSHV